MRRFRWWRRMQGGRWWCFELCSPTEDGPLRTRQWGHCCDPSCELEVCPWGELPGRVVSYEDYHSTAFPALAHVPDLEHDVAHAEVCMCP
jgi:hypothetical protein